MNIAALVNKINPSATELFIVIQTGVYRHGIGGVFDTEALAISAAEELLKQEPDTYHYYEIVKVRLNAVQPFGQGYHNPVNEVVRRLDKKHRRGEG